MKSLHMCFAKAVTMLLLLGVMGRIVSVQAEEREAGAQAAGKYDAFTERGSEGEVTPSEKDGAYVLEESGEIAWRTLFDRKMDSPSNQWVYAKNSCDAGHLKSAGRRMFYLYRRWPNSKEAPWAARSYADILFERKQWKGAFQAYQYLIDNYSSRMPDYNSVLERQFEIAMKIMNRKRMRWIFGGYRAPEYAVEYFEKVIRNGPQNARAPEARFMVGKCHQDTEEYELAISAYRILGYRYPGSKFAEEGGWQHIYCLKELWREFPNSSELLDRMLTTTTVFLSRFTQSKYRNEIIQLRNKLYEVQAAKAFNEAGFYANIPRKPEAAVIYYKKMMEKYPKSKLMPDAREKAAVLEALTDRPVNIRRPVSPRSRPLPFTTGFGHAEG